MSRHLGGRMSPEEMSLRIICLEKSLKKANYRIYLLEKGKDLVAEAKKFFEIEKVKDPAVQLELFQAVGE